MTRMSNMSQKASGPADEAQNGLSAHGTIGRERLAAASLPVLTERTADQNWL